MKTAAILSYRLRGADGVSIEAEKWADALETLGFAVRRIAGEPAEGVTVVVGLGITPARVVDRLALHDALVGADVVVVENICSLPLNPAAGAAVAEALRGRRAILRHHDLAWHRQETAKLGPPPDDPAWIHVTISQHHREELLEHGIDATVLYNRFDVDPPAGDRLGTRLAAGIDDDRLLVLQPTRAIRRKNVPAGLHLAEMLNGTYWLTAAAEDGYADELASILARATVPVVRGPGPGTIDDLYAACDVVVFPSTWEGFGNPVIESVTHRRPLALGDYPVAEEIRAMGFEFFSPTEPEPLLRFLADPDEDLLERNHRRARLRFDLADLPGVLRHLLDRVGATGEITSADR
jgi:glycosyltransferase involved in cell wall biosynthesis